MKSPELGISQEIFPNALVDIEQVTGTLSSEVLEKSVSAMEAIRTQLLKGRE